MRLKLREEKEIEEDIGAYNKMGKELTGQDKRVVEFLSKS